MCRRKPRVCKHRNKSTVQNTTIRNKSIKKDVKGELSSRLVSFQAPLVPTDLKSYLHVIFLKNWDYFGWRTANGVSIFGAACWVKSHGKHTAALCVSRLAAYPTPFSRLGRNSQEHSPPHSSTSDKKHSLLYNNKPMARASYQHTSQDGNLMTSATKHLDVLNVASSEN